MRGEGGARSQPMSTAGAQINLGDLISYLTYATFTKTGFLKPGLYLLHLTPSKRIFEINYFIYILKYSTFLTK
jgi:hypothetical protein